MQDNNKLNENEYFISILSNAYEDEEYKEHLINILEMDDEDRYRILKSMITQMKENNESKSLIEAFSYLLDDEIAKKALKIIK